MGRERTRLSSTRAQMDSYFVQNRQVHVTSSPHDDSKPASTRPKNHPTLAAGLRAAG
jgi:hypothetical protein